jgi:hypothetical protein
VTDTRRLSDQVRAAAFLVLVPLLALLVVPLLVLELPPSYEARFGGTPGTFTAVEQRCAEPEACTWYGDFRSDDGSTLRRDVRVVEGRVAERGETLDAVDVGRDGAVYRAGGWNWLVSTVLLLGALAALALWGRRVRRLLRARRERSAG